MAKTEIKKLEEALNAIEEKIDPFLASKGLKGICFQCEKAKEAEVLFIFPTKKETQLFSDEIWLKEVKTAVENGLKAEGIYRRFKGLQLNYGYTTLSEYLKQVREEYGEEGNGDQLGEHVISPGEAPPEDKEENFALLNKENWDNVQLAQERIELHLLNEEFFDSVTLTLSEAGVIEGNFFLSKKFFFDHLEELNIAQFCGSVMSYELQKWAFLANISYEMTASFVSYEDSPKRGVRKLQRTLELFSKRYIEEVFVSTDDRLCVLVALKNVGLPQSKIAEIKDGVSNLLNSKLITLHSSVKEKEIDLRFQLFKGLYLSEEDQVRQILDLQQELSREDISRITVSLQGALDILEKIPDNVTRSYQLGRKMICVSKEIGGYLVASKTSGQWYKEELFESENGAKECFLRKYLSFAGRGDVLTKLVENSSIF